MMAGPFGVSVEGPDLGKMELAEDTNIHGDSIWKFEAINKDTASKVFSGVVIEKEVL